MIQNLVNTALGTGSTSIWNVAISLILAFVLSLVVAVVYRSTHKGLSYSQSFTFSLILVGVLISSIMMIIGSNLALAFGAFGALSLIRYRTAIKDPKDIAFILLSVAIGMGTGSGNHSIAIVTTIVASAVIYGLTKTNFGSIRKYDYILNFSAESNKFSNEKMKELSDQFLKYSGLLNVTARENGNMMDYTFNIKFISDQDIEKFVQKLETLDGVSSVQVLTARNDIEY